MPPKVIKTGFDNPVGEDVALELIDGKEPAVSTTLKNSENIYKSYLYMKKLYTGRLSSGKIFSIGSVANAEYEVVTLQADASEMRISNTASSNSFVKINGGEYKMQPGEIMTIPIVCPLPSATPPVAGDNLQLKGEVSYIVMTPAE